MFFIMIIYNKLCDIGGLVWQHYKKTNFQTNTTETHCIFMNHNKDNYKGANCKDKRVEAEQCGCY